MTKIYKGIRFIERNHCDIVNRLKIKQGHVVYWKKGIGKESFYKAEYENKEGYRWFSFGNNLKQLIKNIVGQK